MSSRPLSSLLSFALAALLLLLVLLVLLVPPVGCFWLPVSGRACAQCWLDRTRRDRDWWEWQFVPRRPGASVHLAPIGCKGGMERVGCCRGLLPSSSSRRPSGLQLPSAPSLAAAGAVRQRNSARVRLAAAAAWPCCDLCAFAAPYGSCHLPSSEPVSISISSCSACCLRPGLWTD